MKASVRMEDRQEAPGRGRTHRIASRAVVRVKPKEVGTPHPSNGKGCQGQPVGGPGGCMEGDEKKVQLDLGWPGTGLGETPDPPEPCWLGIPAPKCSGRAMFRVRRFWTSEYLHTASWLSVASQKIAMPDQMRRSRMAENGSLPAPPPRCPGAWAQDQMWAQGVRAVHAFLKPQSPRSRAELTLGTQVPPPLFFGSSNLPFRGLQAGTRGWRVWTRPGPDSWGRRHLTPLFPRSSQPKIVKSSWAAKGCQGPALSRRP